MDIKYVSPIVKETGLGDSAELKPGTAARVVTLPTRLAEDLDEDFKLEPEKHVILYATTTDKTTKERTCLLLSVVSTVRVRS